MGSPFIEIRSAAWRLARRAIRDPRLRCRLIQFLAMDDLVIVGDVYASTTSPAPVVLVPDGHSGVFIGCFGAHDGPAVIVPRGCKPPSPQGGEVV